MREIIENQTVENKIFTLRGKQVMLDSDLAKLYQVETKRINEAVRRNPEKFPNDLMFDMTKEETESLKSQNATFKESLNNRKYLPKVFTEQGVYMLATVLKSKVATDVTLSIMRTFTKMKHFLSQNANLFAKIDAIEKRQITYELTTDEKLKKIFNTLEDKSIKPTQGIFFDGQIFDAYEFVSNLIKSAKKDIVLVD
ncbi:MAG: ORF6N domain-containing protein, partial [Campylobacterales bacterium]